MAKAKNGNGIWKKIGIIILMATTFAGIVGAFVTNTHQIKDNGKSIADHEERLRPVEKDLNSLSAHIEHIKITLDKIEKKLP